VIVHHVAADDPRLADFVGLTDIALRRRREAEHGLFLAEGEKVIRRAVVAGYPLRAVLTAPRWLDGLSDVLANWTGPVYVADEPALERVTGFNVHRGALAALDRLPLPSLAAVCAPANRLVVLEGIVDHTNVGAIIRSAAGLGVDGLVLDPRCADPLYRRSVKVSMGAVFALPWTRCVRWPGDLEILRDHGFSLVALTPDPAAVPLTQIGGGPEQRVALMFGTEGAGLSRHALAACDVRARIPMHAGVDSLNVATAAAIACYELVRR
jgi:tRNA G18 (ribose-2'-O)-methylase SpoU